MKIRQLYKIIVALSLCVPLTMHNSNEVNAVNFEGNESKYYTLCTSKQLSRSDRNTCNSFNTYLKNKSTKLKQNIESTKNEMNSTQSSISSMQTKIDEIATQIVNTEKQIAYVKESIKNAEDKLKEKESTLKERIYATQSATNSNTYISYLFGADSFSDFFSRIATLGDVTSYESELIKEINEEKEKLATQKKTLEVTEANLNTSKKEAKVLLSNYQSKFASQSEAVKNATENLTENDQNIESIGQNLEDIRKAEEQERIKAAQVAALKARLAAEKAAAEKRAREAAAANASRNTQTNTNTNNSSSKSSSSNNNSNNNVTVSSGGSSLGYSIAQKALSKRGSWYLWGAAGPNRFDCSGLVWWAHKELGIKFGRTNTKGLSTMGQNVPYGSMQPGDIILFSSNGSYSGIHHTGIYIGGGAMVHAPHTGAQVSVVSVTSGYYRRQFYNARRLY